MPHRGAIALSLGGQIGLATLAGRTAIAVEAGALRISVELARPETRELALRLIEATQLGEEE
jgi:hypothetical protein